MVPFALLAVAVAVQMEALAEIGLVYQDKQVQAEPLEEMVKTLVDLAVMVDLLAEVTGLVAVAVV